MKKVKLIEEIISKKKVELEKFSENRRKVELDKKEELTEAMEYFFPEVLNDDTHLEVSGDYIYFKKKSEDYNYPKEILTLSMRGVGWRDREIKNIETGFYSTTENSIFELERMVVIGRVGQILLDFSDDIIANWNCVVEKYKSILSKANNKVWDKEKEISNLDTEIDNLKRGYRKTQLLSLEGIKFKETESYRDKVCLDIRWDWTIKGIRGVKVTKVTPSGKSYDLTLTREREKYNEKTSSYDIFLEDLKVQKVRAYKVIDMINYNSEKIES